MVSSLPSETNRDFSVVYYTRCISGYFSGDSYTWSKAYWSSSKSVHLLLSKKLKTKNWFKKRLKLFNRISLWSWAKPKILITNRSQTFYSFIIPYRRIVSSGFKTTSASTGWLPPSSILLGSSTVSSSSFKCVSWDMENRSESKSISTLCLWIQERSK
jgi:hypothetical protein